MAEEDNNLEEEYEKLKEELEAEKKEKKENQAQKLIQMASHIELFATPSEEVYASIPLEGRTETYKLNSRRFKAYLKRRFYQAEDKPPGNQALTDALGMLEAEALESGVREEVHFRTATHGNNIYVDLGTDDWKVIEVSPAGWRVIQEPPVKFRRSPIMQPLPLPSTSGNVEALKPFLNYQDEDQYKLIISWLIAALRPNSPYPILNFVAEQGASKSTMSKVVRGLVDPSTLPLRALPKDERDLSIAASNTHVMAFDNLSSLSNTMSDALAKVATGGGLATRALHTDDEEAVFFFQKPVLANGISDIVQRQDLLDRSLIINLPPIPESKRMDEHTFFQQYEQVQAEVLGGILDALSGALQQLPHTRLEKPPRMADFALFITAAEESLGWEEGSFLAAYERSRQKAISENLETNPLASAILSFMNDKTSWQGTVSELNQKLGELTDERTKRSKAWPSERKLKEWMRRIRPGLRAQGVDYVDIPRNSQGARIRLIKEDQSTEDGDKGGEVVYL